MHMWIFDVYRRMRGQCPRCAGPKNYRYWTVIWAQWRWPDSYGYHDQRFGPCPDGFHDRDADYAFKGPSGDYYLDKALRALDIAGE